MRRKATSRAAIDSWQQIESQNPAYLALVAQRLLAAYRALDRRDDGLRLLRGYLENYHSLDLLDVVFQLVLESDGAEVATRWCAMSCAATRRCSASTSCSKPACSTPRRKSGRISTSPRASFQNYTRRLARYRCDNCGFKARQFYWRCPACGGWETYPPKRTEEFDLTPDEASKTDKPGVLPDLSAARLLVVGDVMLDRYWFGDVSRISPEAPVPVVKVEVSEERPGGAANVARNAAARLGHRCPCFRWLVTMRPGWRWGASWSAEGAHEPAP